MNNYEEEYELPTEIKIVRLVKEKIRKVLSHLYDAVLVIAIVGTIGMLCSGYRFLWIASESMVPTLKVHQIVLAKQVEPEAVGIGDIATYKVPDKPYTITHRIVGEQEDCFVFKGDNNEVEDAPVLKEYVKYKIVKY